MSVFTFFMICLKPPTFRLVDKRYTGGLSEHIFVVLLLNTTLHKYKNSQISTQSLISIHRTKGIDERVLWC